MSAGRLPGPLRRLLTQPAVEPVISTLLRGALLRETPGFVARELRGSRALARYTLRGAPVRVALQHGTPDVLVFDELFYQRVYAPPEDPARVLAGLPAPLRVLDVGANIGLFGAWVLAGHPDARITAFEPDPRNAAVHRRTVAANRTDGRWELVEAAAATAGGALRFTAGQFAMSGPADPGDPTAVDVPAVDVLPHLRRCDFLKLDAEGSEWAILDDPRFQDTTARVVALEYHPDGCPEADPRAAAERRLGAAGFAVSWQPTNVPEGYGSLWAWR